MKKYVSGNKGRNKVVSSITFVDRRNSLSLEMEEKERNLMILQESIETLTQLVKTQVEGLKLRIRNIEQKLT